MTKLFVAIVILILPLISSCVEQTDKPIDEKRPEGFVWSESVKISDIPNHNLKGVLNGKEVSFEYINFEQWRGSGDNVFNFGNKKPGQNCGYVENDAAFQLMRNGAEIQTGDLITEDFSKSLDGFVADFHYFDGKEDISVVRVDWNLALVIEEMTENRVKGRIAMCFNDEAKSWIAGNFEAIRCYN